MKLATLCYLKKDGHTLTALPDVFRVMNGMKFCAPRPHPGPSLYRPEMMYNYARHAGKLMRC